MEELGLLFSTLVDKHYLNENADKTKAYAKQGNEADMCGRDLERETVRKRERVKETWGGGRERERKRIREKQKESE